MDQTNALIFTVDLLSCDSGQRGQSRGLLRYREIANYHRTLKPACPIHLAISYRDALGELGCLGQACLTGCVCGGGVNVYQERRSPEKPLAFQAGT